MPINYVIDRERGFILETWTGLITRNDLENYWVEYLKDPEVLRLRRTLADIRAAKIEFNGSDLMALIKKVVIPKLGDLKWKTAILVDDPVQFGVARQYGALADLYSRDQIFKDRDTALSWLLNA
jgi:hypothetical protein